MSIEQYNLMKSLYERTKPIRGRPHEVRPISDRRRDWEQVVQERYRVAYRQFKIASPLEPTN